MTYVSNFDDWQSSSGLSDDNTKSPSTYARRLVSYIKDCSTVRVRTIERWGSSPSVSQIKKMRKAWEIENDYESPKTKEVLSSIEQNDDRINKVNEFMEKVNKDPVFVSNTIAGKCYRALGIRGSEAIKGIHSEISTQATSFVLAVMLSYGLTKGEAGRIYQRYPGSTVVSKVNKFFNNYIKNPKMLQAWKDVAPDEFKEITDWQEFKTKISI